MSTRQLSPDLDLIFMVQFLVMRSVCLLPYNLGLSYLVHTLIMEGACQSDICHLTLTSFSHYTDFIKLLSSFCDYISFYITILPRFTIFGPYIDDLRYMSAGYRSMVHLFCLFSEKYFTPTISEGRQDIYLSTFICFSFKEL